MPRKRSVDIPTTPFAERLVQVRELYGMQTGRPDLDKGEFAKLLGKQGQTYRRYELGETEPNLTTLAKIRELTGVSLNYLICGQPDSKRARVIQAPPHLVSDRTKK